MKYDNLIEESAAKLLAGNVILFPSETNWLLACELENQEALDKLAKISRKSNQFPILLMSSVEMLKKHVQEIHPRIETLLIYNKRPLTIIFKEHELPFRFKDKSNKLAVRIMYDDFCQGLIKKIKKPIIGLPIVNEQELKAINFTDIDSYVKDQVDFICLNEELEQTYDMLSVLVSFNQEGELQFLRN